MAENDNTALIKNALHDMYKEVTLPQGSAEVSTKPGTGVVAAPDISHRADNVSTNPNDVPRTDVLATPTTADPGYRGDEAAKGSNMAATQPIGVVGAMDLGNRNDDIDARRDSDVGPRNEISPEHHHHHHHEEQIVHDEKHKHEHHVPKEANGSSAPAKSTGGIDYGNTTSTLGGASSPSTDNGPRRHSLALSPHRGHIDSTVSAAQPSKKWSFTMGDFGLKLPQQPSNAVSQELNRDGSVSMQGGQGPQGRVGRGIGSISSTVKRGSVDATVSARDKNKKWSLGDGDFGLKLPGQRGNSVDVDAVERDGDMSARAGGGDNAALGRQNARGIGSISPSVRRGSVDASVSQHDKYRKWSLKDADFGLKWPGRGSNLQN